jgi:hypothetical protein
MVGEKSRCAEARVWPREGDGWKGEGEKKKDGEEQDSKMHKVNVHKNTERKYRGPHTGKNAHGTERERGLAEGEATVKQTEA